MLNITVLVFINKNRSTDNRVVVENEKSFFGSTNSLVKCNVVAGEIRQIRKHQLEHKN